MVVARRDCGDCGHAPAARDWLVPAEASARSRGVRWRGGDGTVTWPRDTPPGPQPAEQEAYRILRSRIDLSRLPAHSRDVTERVIYASADFDYATDLVC